MFYTPSQSEIMYVAKLTRMFWWPLMAEPEEVNLLVGPFPVYHMSKSIIIKEGKRVSNATYAACNNLCMRKRHIISNVLNVC